MTQEDILEGSRLKDCPVRKRKRSKKEKDETGLGYDRIGVTSQRAVRLPALDGGWGWMCVLACALMHFLLGGYGRSFGVVYVEMLQRFDCSATTGSTIGGIFTALRMGCGPIVSALTKRFSKRAVTGLGALLFATGAFLSGLSTSATYMLLTYSLLSGVGAALVYFPSVVIVGEYFDRRRGIAMGLATAGSGIGCVAIPPLYRFMFDYYGYQGTFIIVSGALLNLLICTALYRPLAQSQPRQSTLACQQASDTSLANNSVTLSHDVNRNEQNLSEEQPINNSQTTYHNADQHASSEMVLSGVARQISKESLDSLMICDVWDSTQKPILDHNEDDDFLLQDSPDDLVIFGVPGMTIEAAITGSFYVPTPVLLFQSDDTDALHCEDSKPVFHNALAQCNSYTGAEDLDPHSAESVKTELIDFEDFVHNSCHDAAAQSDDDYERWLLHERPVAPAPPFLSHSTRPSSPTPSSISSSSSSLVSLHDTSSAHSCCRRFVVMLKSINSYFDLHLLGDPSVTTYVLALSLATMAYISAQNLIVAHAIQVDVDPSQAVYILSFIGVADTLGRVLSGLLYDVTFIRRVRSYVYVFILFGSGVSIIGWALCKTFVQLAILSAANGAFNGAIVAGRPVVITDLVGVEYLSSTFGLTVFGQGVFILVGPIIAGYLKDVTGTYFMTFIFAGSSSCFAALLFLTGLLFKKYCTKPQKHQPAQNVLTV